MVIVLKFIFKALRRLFSSQGFYIIYVLGIFLLELSYVVSSCSQLIPQSRSFYLCTSFTHLIDMEKAPFANHAPAPYAPSASLKVKALVFELADADQ